MLAFHSETMTPTEMTDYLLGCSTPSAGAEGVAKLECSEENLRDAYLA